MSAWKEELQRRLTERQRWEEFGAKYLALIWGSVAVLSLLWPFPSITLIPVFAVGLVVQTLVFALKPSNSPPLTLHLLWLLGGVVAFVAASLAPAAAVLTPSAGRILLVLVLGGITFYTGSLKSRLSFVLAGVAFVGLSVALALGLGNVWGAVITMVVLAGAVFFTRD